MRLDVERQEEHGRLVKSAFRLGIRHNSAEMARDLHRPWWRFAAASALLLALALLLVPQVQHGHASLLLVALAPVLLVFCVPATEQQRTFTDERVFSFDPILPLPSLSHLPPPDTLA